jgi:acyl-CoA thioester hydrolase
MPKPSPIKKNDYTLWEDCAVRASDMDARGHVNNATYFAYFEIVRTNFFMDSPAIAGRQSAGHAPFIVAQECSYHGQIRYPADVEIGMRVKKIGNKSFASEYVVCRRGESEALALGSSTHAWTLVKEGKATPIPEDVRAALEALIRS